MINWEHLSLCRTESGRRRSRYATGKVKFTLVVRLVSQQKRRARLTRRNLRQTLLEWQAKLVFDNRRRTRLERKFKLLFVTRWRLTKREIKLLTSDRLPPERKFELLPTRTDTKVLTGEHLNLIRVPHVTRKRLLRTDKRTTGSAFQGQFHLTGLWFSRATRSQNVSRLAAPQVRCAAEGCADGEASSKRVDQPLDVLRVGEVLA